MGELAASSSSLLTETGWSLPQSVLLGEGSKLGCALPSGTATLSSAELLSCTVTELCRGPELLVLSETTSVGRQ